MAVNKNECDACGQPLPQKPAVYKKARLCTPKCKEVYRKRLMGRKARPPGS
jgi:hypothetical protein